MHSLRTEAFVTSACHDYAFLLTDDIVSSAQNIQEAPFGAQTEGGIP